MKNKIWDVIGKFSKKRALKKEAEQSRARIDALFDHIFRYEDIEIPLPNLFADTLIRDRFGDDLAFDDVEKVAEILFILENQGNPDIAKQSPEKRRESVHKRMIAIPAEDKEKYQKAIFEMFVALKKNSIRQEMAVLEQAKQILDSRLAKSP